MLMDPLPRFVGVNNDPVFAAIKAHRAAVQEMLVAHEAAERADHAARGTRDAALAKLYREAEKTHTAAQSEERKAERQLILTKPTTSAGLAALFKYAAGDIHSNLGTSNVGWASDLLKTVGSTLDAKAREEEGAIRCFNANALAARKARETAKEEA